jgi:hypothetical protein
MTESDNIKRAKKEINKAIDRFIRKYESEILSIPEKQTHLKIKSFHRLENDIDIERYEIIDAYSDILTNEEKDMLKSIYKDKIYIHFFNKD